MNVTSGNKTNRKLRSNCGPHSILKWLVKCSCVLYVCASFVDCKNVKLFTKLHPQSALSRDLYIYIFVSQQNEQNSKTWVNISRFQSIRWWNIAVAWNCSFAHFLLKDYGYVSFLLTFYCHCEIVIEEMCMIKIGMLETNWQTTNECKTKHILARRQKVLVQFSRLPLFVSTKSSWILHSQFP